ncbi:DedA family protein [Aurantimonas sp. A2-1-M11]|uniref:DedA family protein n=1 Tax=Aurantimonas sp. A2-1-M11 TaxID=3113712 RepID=UPI002F92773D
MMETLGPFGIALLMFLENIFPPIPSELIMPLAGYQSATGQMSLFTVILAGTVGSLLGVIPWYYAGRFVGEPRLIRFTERHGRWLTMGPEDVEAADRWFRKYGIAAVFFGRLVPAVRTLISVPAGIARMSFLTFLIFSAAGSAIWTSFLAYAGYALGQNYEAVESYVGPVSNVVLIAIVAFYIYRVATFDRNHKRSEPNTDDASG